MSTLSYQTDAFPAVFERIRERGLVVGGGALLLGIIIGFISPASFYPAYLASYLLFLGFGLGSLAFLLIHYLVGGNWGFLIRRPLEAAAMTLPILGLLFLPILLFGMSTIYPWADPAKVKESHILSLKTGYLNVPFFLVRTLFYFGFWSVLAIFFRRTGIKQDEVSDPAITRRAAAIAAPGMLFLFLSVTFAMIDFSMSIEPEWYSSIYAVMLFTGFGLSSLALAVVVINPLRDVKPLSELIGPQGLNDIGNLMLAFTMLWAYMSFSQYLIIWSGNLTEEIPWYLKRSVGLWRLVCAALILFHFFAPFFYLLIKDNKRSTTKLVRVAVWIIGIHLINDIWLIVPAYTGSRLWAELLCLIPAILGVGGIWSWAYIGQLTSRPLVPRNDPLLAEVLKHQHAHAHAGGGH